MHSLYNIYIYYLYVVIQQAVGQSSGLYCHLERDIDLMEEFLTLSGEMTELPPQYQIDGGSSPHVLEKMRYIIYMAPFKFFLVCHSPLSHKSSYS